MQIAVCGATACGGDLREAARVAGRTLAGHGAVVLTGGRGGVMAAAARGAREAGGVVVGILPDLADGNPYLSIRIRTGMGHARNAVLVQSADAVVAIGGEFGTLSELAIALKEGIPVATYGCRWDLPGAVACATPEEAALAAIRAASSAARPCS